MIYIILTIIAMSLYRKGLSFYIISCVLFLLFYYPVLISDYVYIWDANQQVIYEVSEESRILIYVVIWLFIISNHFSRRSSKFQFEYEKINGVNAALILAITCLPLLYYLLINIESLSAGSIDKVELMEGRSYLSNYIEASSLLLFSYGLFTRSKLITGTALFLAVIQMKMGFRYVAAHQLVIFLLFYSLTHRRISTKITIIMSICATLIIGLKIFNYQIPTLEQITDIISKIKDENSDTFLISNKFNPESTSISVVFNEIVIKNYRIDAHYYVDILWSVIPMMPTLFGVEVHGFAGYLKSTLLGSDAESFASGMPSFYFAIGGPFTFIIFIALQYYLLSWLFGFVKVKKLGVHFRTFVISIISVFICYGLRSDPVYLMTLIRNIAASAFIFYIAMNIFRALKLSKSECVVDRK